MCTHVHTHTHAYFITFTRTRAHYSRFYVASQSMLLPNCVTLSSSVLVLPLCHYSPLICRRRMRWDLPLNCSVERMMDRRHFQLQSGHNLLPPPKIASTTITQSPWPSLPLLSPFRWLLLHYPLLAAADYPLLAAADMVSLSISNFYPLLHHSVTTHSFSAPPLFPFAISTVFGFALLWLFWLPQLVSLWLSPLLS